MAWSAAIGWPSASVLEQRGLHAGQRRIVFDDRRVGRECHGEAGVEHRPDRIDARQQRVRQVLAEVASELVHEDRLRHGDDAAPGGAGQLRRQSAGRSARCDAAPAAVPSAS